MLLRLLLMLLLILPLSACQGPFAVRSGEASLTQPMDWQQRRLQLQQRSVWRVHGRVAVQTEDEAWSATIRWTQTGAQYEMAIYGPLGGTILYIQGTDSRITLTTEQGETYTGTDAQRLIERHAGWNVPLDGLRYWLLALSQPGRSQWQRYDDDGRLKELHQSGWRIRYRGYQPINGIDMPEKIHIENEQLTVRLIVRDWLLGDIGQVAL